MEPIKERPNYWGNPMLDEFKTNIEPLNQELGKMLVARSCVVPHCNNVATWDEYCDQHLVEIDKSYNEWLEWKAEQNLDHYFIPYEDLP